MGKKVYVNGSILIDTSDFKCKGVTALYTIPEGVESVNADMEFQGDHFFIIDDDHPQSLFNEYYATGGFTQLYNTSYYLFTDKDRAISTYKERKNEIEKVLNNLYLFDNNNKLFICKLLLLNVISLFDAFASEIIISKIISTEDCFNAYYTKFYSELPSSKKRHYDKLDRGSLEKEVIYTIMETSFASVKNTNNLFSDVYGFKVIYDNNPVVELFELRHRIVHRNGRKKDGSFYQFTDNDVNNALIIVDELVQNMLGLITAIE